eukprot:gene31450-40848_t
MTLVDMDEVCISNVNRQLCAVSSSVGKFKADVLKDRVLDINPHAKGTFDYVVDAADGVSDKAAIVHQCVQTETPVVCSGGVGGLVDPSLLLTSDLATAKGDGLLMRVRKKLRQDYGYRQEKGKVQKKKVKSWQIMTVHTSPTGFKRGGDASNNNDDEKEDENGEEESSTCSVGESSATTGGFRQCDVKYGSGTFITGTVGFMLSGIVVNAIALGRPLKPRSLQWMTQRRSLSGDNTSGSDNENYDSRDEEGNLVAKTTSSTTITTTAIPTSQPEKECPTINSEKFIKNKGEQISAVSSSEDIVFEVILPQKEMSFSSVSHPLFDAHCHIQLSPLFAVAEQVIEQSKRLGITKAAVCGTCPGDDWDRVRLLYEQHPDFILPQFGLHPWYIQRYAETLVNNRVSSSPSIQEANPTSSATNTVTKSTPEVSETSSLFCTTTLADLLKHQLRQQLEQSLQRCATAGVGECGLDRNIIAAGKPEKASKQQPLESLPIGDTKLTGSTIPTMVDMDLQMKILSWHLEIAAEYRRPVTIHCVSGCWDHLLRLLKDKDMTSTVMSGRIPSIILHSCHSLPVDMLPAFFSAVGDTYALKKHAQSTSTTTSKLKNRKEKGEPIPEFQIIESSPTSSSEHSPTSRDDEGDNSDSGSHCRLYFSMSGRVFGSPKGIRLARSVPFSRLLLESDSPDQLPVPFMARQLDISSERLAMQTSDNARKAYRASFL